jgi:lipopolysaccharide exporter
MAKSFRRLLVYSLKFDVVRGSVWLGIGSGAVQVFRLLHNMILTRVLAPEIFGVMSIVLAVNAVILAFTEIGIKHAIIQNLRGDKATFLNVAWWISLLRAIASYTVAFVVAPWIAQFYGNTELTVLLRVAFVSVFFQSMISPRAYVDVKQMNFMRWVIIFNGGGVCGILTSLLLALAIGNVWGLVLGFVVESGACFLLSYLLFPFRPGFTFDKESTRSLLQYTRGAFGAPILTFIFMRADIFVIGKLCSSSDLGLYSMVVGLAQVSISTISYLLPQITLPMFSKMQTDTHRINTVLSKITSAITYLGFPALILVALYSREILFFVYGEQYTALYLAFAIAFAASILKVFSAPIVNIYFALGRPDLNRLFTGIRAILIIILLYPAIRWFGVTGAAVASFIAMVTEYILQTLQLRKLVKLDLRVYYRLFLPGAGISLCIVPVWYLTRNYFSSQTLLNLILGISGYLLVYGIAIARVMKVLGLRMRSDGG